MKSLAMATSCVFLLGAAAIFAVPLPQCTEGETEQPAEPQNVTEPEFVVIYTLKREKQFDPLMEFRILIHAKSEGEAVMKSTILVQKTFGVNAIDILEFNQSGMKK